MTPRSYQGVVVDLCSRCGSVYLDPGEGEGTGIDEATLFGRDARPAGPSSRRCPCGQANMTRFAVNVGNETIEIDRSSCCGGVFLDAGEHGALVKRTAALTNVQSTTRGCPRCSQPLSSGDGVESCASCKAMFLDPAVLAAKGVDVSALFAIGPESAQELGPSTLSCPLHAQVMVRLEITLFEQRWEIERASCCGGVFLDAGEQSPFEAAARRAKMAWGDQEFTAGRSSMDEKAMIEAQKANALIGQRMATDAAIEAVKERERRMQQMMEGRRRRRRGGVAGLVFDIVVDSSWDDDDW